MKFQWFGAAHFLITTDTGIKIAMDPFQHNIIVEGTNLPPGGNVIRPTYTGEADVVTMSHGHFDHSYVWPLKGMPRLYTGGASKEYKGVKFSSVNTYHGLGRTGPISFNCIEADGIRAYHTGDHGHVLSNEQLAQFGRVDVLMTNWDDDRGQMTFEVLEKVLAQLKPKVVFPMHHTKVTPFMTDRKNFIDHRKDNVTEIEFTAGTLPSDMMVILLKPSLGNPINFFEEA